MGDDVHSVFLRGPRERIAGTEPIQHTVSVFFGSAARPSW